MQLYSQILRFLFDLFVFLLPYLFFLFILCLLIKRVVTDENVSKAEQKLDRIMKLRDIEDAEKAKQEFLIENARRKKNKKTTQTKRLLHFKKIKTLRKRFIRL